MTKYITKQRTLLLNLLLSHPHEAFSARQIYSKLKQNNISISAVYRNLILLENENLIKRISKSGSREIFYQCKATPECQESLHLTCEKCGKAYHMKNDHVQTLVQDVLQKEKFIVNKTNSMLYGICENCQHVKATPHN